MQISRSIVDAVRSRGGRFLEKNPSTGYYSDIGDRKAIEKTSQALRDGAASLRKQLSADLGDPDFLSAVFENDSNAENAAAPNKPAQPKEKPKPAKVRERNQLLSGCSALQTSHFFVLYHRPKLLRKRSTVEPIPIRTA